MRLLQFPSAATNSTVARLITLRSGQPQRITAINWLQCRRLKSSSSSGDNNGGAGRKSGSSKKPLEAENAPKNLDQLQKALQVIESTLISKPPPPDAKSELIAVAIPRRPLFPGFYKTVNIRQPSLIQAIKDNMQRNQNYLSVFLNRIEPDEGDEDLGSSGHIPERLDRIHPVGVLAQISNAMPGPNESMTLLLYPIKRVVVEKFIPPAAVDTASVASLSNDVNQQSSDQDSDGQKCNDEGFGGDFNDHEDDEEHGDPKNIFTYVKPLKRSGTSSDSNSQTLQKVSRVVVERLKDDLESEASDKEESGAESETASSPGKLKPSRAIVKQIMDTFNEIVKFNPLVREQVNDFMRTFGSKNGLYEDPSKLADFAAAMSDAEPNELQQVLESTKLDDRLRKSLLLLKKELANAKLQNEISQDVERMIGERDRENFLQNRLKNIQKELGLETVAREKLAAKFRSRVKDLVMPEAVKKIYDEELNKLMNLKPAAQEFSITSNYLDWLTLIPWGKRSDENFDLHRAQQVLDRDHYGLKDVKERIMEFIAVGKMRGSVEGKIICLVGPPGVGKTSIGRSIAHALEREFYRLSVGGMYDVAEIKGHRRTYVGAMPGKIVQALKSVQTENPIILIDEIDKIGGHGRHSGDPSSALLEVLDPEQNSSFLDHYMDVPIDLSKVLFVCTANILDTIPGPLLDRMEVIRLSGYLSEEKKAIALNYLAPEARKMAGLDKYEIQLSEGAIEGLINHYCRENGVRNLKKHVEKIYRKAAFQVVSGKNDKITIDEQKLKEYIGAPVFTSERMYANMPEGVVMGLAYSSLGGSTLYIESVTDFPVTSKSKPAFAQTGNMGDVMKESTRIAHSFAKSFLESIDKENKFFDHASVHLHVPEGAIPKDGPSAGIAMCTSLISLATGKPLAIDVAMTGELSLTGKVLRIGGVKEKVMAAKRAGVQHIILPRDNRPDYEELAGNVTAGIQAHFVEHYRDVYQLVFDPKK